MDFGENSKNGKGKANTNKAGASGLRAKPIHWPPVLSEFVLDWYIEKKMEMPPKTVFKKVHHTACTKVVNGKYGSTYTVDQVHRHYRRHKETWSLVARHMNVSGNGWDDVTKTFSLFKSALDELSVNDRGILTKPIQFFGKLQELFSGSSADGTFMHDPSTAADSDNECDTQESINDMSAYAKTKCPNGEDSDKLELDSDDCKEVAAVAAANVGDLKPNKKNFKRPGKEKTLPTSQSNKKTKSPAAGRDDNDMDVMLTSTLVGIKENLTKPIQTLPPLDPNAPLWNMLKNVALPPDDKMAVGMYLCKPELQVQRNFLMAMGEEYLERWVVNHFSRDDLDANGPPGHGLGHGPTSF
ncbi:uncharacterized protein LOC100828285 [Brachypodium distachyon]|uniref:Myb/SANT-like domain-containing protein n=1 Tax=Brachypodium distachyon TaxID=15368 RepID=A0A0Q3GKH2_BRADI|nr:uncharacterized protein LOC100828285 [Brachypodium distachyon]KQK11624.1 hypothetical protein BRADI_2g61280v3 [Brachypodium distachyon]|eukprot:XP_010233608.1 uncharacterized protein LOC100828285 [Brachypodium distachyon]